MTPEEEEALRKDLAKAENENETLRSDAQENVRIMGERQEELHAAQAENATLTGQVKDLTEEAEIAAQDRERTMREREQLTEENGRLADSLQAANNRRWWNGLYASVASAALALLVCGGLGSYGIGLMGGDTVTVPSTPPVATNPAPAPVPGAPALPAHLTTDPLKATAMSGSPQSAATVIGKDEYLVHQGNNVMIIRGVKSNGGWFNDIKLGKEVPRHCATPLAGAKYDGWRIEVTRDEEPACPDRKWIPVNPDGFHHSGRPGDLAFVNQIGIDPVASANVANVTLANQLQLMQQLKANGTIK